MAPIESLNFPLKLHKSDFCLLHCFQYFYLPSSYRTSHQARDDDFSAQSSKVLPHSSKAAWSGLSLQPLLSWYQHVLLRVSMPSVKQHHQKQVEKGRVCSAHTSTALFIIKESHEETKAGQGPGGRSWCRGHGGCCSLACSVSFLTEPRTTSPGMAPPTMDWAPHQMLIKKTPYTWIYGDIFPAEAHSFRRV